MLQQPTSGIVGNPCRTSGRELIARSAVLLLAVFGIGVFLVFVGATKGMSRFIYFGVEFPAFGVEAAALLIVGLAARELPAADWLEKLPVSGLVVAVFFTTAIGVHVVYHDYPFSPDEWMPQLQAAIFGHGELVGHVLPEWRDYGRAMYHGFAYYDNNTGALASSYRPGMAALITLFDLGGLGIYVSAFMTAGSVWLTASLGRILWPESPSAPVVAALLVATSSQALTAAMTTYAMPAHLFFNLLWLRLFLLDTWRSHVAAAFVGILTASLHQVHMHIFFAAPFFLLLIRQFRFGVLLWYAVAYLLGHLAIIGWDKLAMGSAVAVASSEATFAQFLDRVTAIARMPGFYDLATVGANLVRFLAWQSLALIPLLLFTAYRRAWPPLLLLIAASMLFSLLPYPFLMPDQGHGWGYRYLHGLIGAVALVGTAGWVQMERMHGRYLRQPVMLCFAATLILVIPARAYLIETTIAPWWKATEAAQAMPADVVIVDDATIYYGHEIPRNDPYVERRPVTMIMSSLSIEQIQSLCRRYKVSYFGPSDAAAWGLDTRAPGNVVPSGDPSPAMAPSQLDETSKREDVLAKYLEKLGYLTTGPCRAAYSKT